MKRVLVSLFYGLCLGSCVYSQNDPIPVLFTKAGESMNIQKKIIVSDDLLSDTLRIFSKVIVRFEHPLRDTLKPVKVRSVEITDLRIYKEKGIKCDVLVDCLKENKVDYSTPVLIERIKKRLQLWYENQPYSMMLGKEEWNNKATFSVTFYMIPRGSSYQK